jgi:hypothetical protein
LEVLPGVGHFAHVEAPNEVAEIIDDFMKATTARGADTATLLAPVAGDETS